jgi:hypothetical protein
VKMCSTVTLSMSNTDLGAIPLAPSGTRRNAGSNVKRALTSFGSLGATETRHGFGGGRFVGLLLGGIIIIVRHVVWVREGAGVPIGYCAGVRWNGICDLPLGKYGFIRRVLLRCARGRHGEIPGHEFTIFLGFGPGAATVVISYDCILNFFGRVHNGQPWKEGLSS